MLCLGDCLSLMPVLPDASVDMVFADLPYGVTANKWDTVIPFEPLWRELLRVAKPNAAFVFTATQPFATALIMSQPKLFRYDLVWEKTTATGHLNAKKMPLRAHEHVLVFYRKAGAYNPQITPATELRGSTSSRSQAQSSNYGYAADKPPWVDNGLRQPRSVIKIGVEKRRASVHPTQKPVALLEWLIKTYSNSGDVILDPTMGSGTTGVAALNTGRRFAGFEKDRSYYQSAKQRISATQARAATPPSTTARPTSGH